MQKCAFDRIRRVVKEISSAFPGQALSRDAVGEPEKWIKSFAIYKSKMSSQKKRAIQNRRLS